MRDRGYTLLIEPSEGRDACHAVLMIVNAFVSRRTIAATSPRTRRQRTPDAGHLSGRPTTNLGRKNDFNLHPVPFAGTPTAFVAYSPRPESLLAKDNTNRLQANLRMRHTDLTIVAVLQRCPTSNAFITLSRTYAMHASHRFSRICKIILES